MIYDELASWRRYVPHRNASEFCQAIEFLRTFTPDSENGKHVLKEGLIYANVQEYTPKDISEGMVEYHREFVDIQTLLSGVENIYYVPTAALTEKSLMTAKRITACTNLLLQKQQPANWNQAILFCFFPAKVTCPVSPSAKTLPR